MGTDDSALTWCPSGQPDAPESVVLGVRSGADGRVTYLAEPVPAADVLGAIPEGIEPTRVLRFASHCVSACAHRRGNDCTLVQRVLAVPVREESRAVPRCHLRGSCKWWSQSGVDACYRCPAVSTAHLADDELATLMADPTATPEQLTAWIAADAADRADAAAPA
ncbi:hypothetical protein ACFO3J_06045 [Streptomyces polygonati]|uniref:Nitrogen fixation protein n=1 Tax=Streptomyces polygonati TaxID=1617087 RepID=A0ABV8HJP7_9ACTN